MDLFGDIDPVKEIKQAIVKAITVFSEEYSLPASGIQICVYLDEDTDPAYAVFNKQVMTSDQKGLLNTVEFINCKKALTFTQLMLQASRQKMDWSGRLPVMNSLFVEPYFKKIFAFAAKEFVVDQTNIRIVFFTNKEIITEKDIFLAIYNQNALIRQVSEQELIEYSEKI